MQDYIYQIILFQILLSFIIIKISYKLKLTDNPKDRKIHVKPVAYTGGLIIGISFLFIVFVTDFNKSYLNLILSYSILISLSGFIDDKYNVNPGTKILLQALPIYLLINQELYLQDIGTYEIFGKITLGSFSKIFTLLCCLLVINSTNYCDGIDSLLAITTFIVLVSFSVYSLLLNNTEVYNYLLIISIPLIIHSLFNFEFVKNFKVFLGDSGSNLLGFIISFITIYLYKYEQIHPSLLIWPLAFLIYEFLTVNLIRFFKGKAIFKPGHDHIHFELSKFFGFKKNFVLITIVLINLFFSFSGYLIFKYLSNVSSIIIYIIFFMLYFLIRWNLNFKLKSIKK